MQMDGMSRGLAFWKAAGVFRALSVLFAVFFLSAVSSSSTASGSSCTNDALRTGASALLPGCRAYELLTPADTNGRLLQAISTFGFGSPHDVFPTELLTSSGNSLVYLAFTGSLSEPAEGNGMLDVYEAVRSPEGWLTTRRLSPSGIQAAVHPDPGGVSADHQFTFSTVAPVSGIAAGSLAADGPAEYLGEPDGSFELVGIGSLGQERYAQGRFITSGGKHVIFTTGASIAQSILCAESPSCPVKQLELEAPPSGTGAIYDRAADGSTHVVSLLPGNKPLAAGEQPFYRGTSKDASSIAFQVKGILYVRVHNGDADKEATLEVSAEEPVFAGLSAQGQYVFYVTGGNRGTIHRYDSENHTDLAVNPGVDGEIVNISADGSHVYFVSEAEINGEGEAGKPNLYVWSNGTSKYVATVLPSDLERTSGNVVGQCPALCGIPALTRWTNYAVVPPSETEPGPGAEASRTTPDGERLLFESRARLTSYDNAGHTAIYLYSAADNSIHCLSCSSALTVPNADARLQEVRRIRPGIVIHNLSEDGSHAFFETSDSLVPEDTDGVNDIYEWNEAEGAGKPLALISSGKSTEYPPPSGNLADSGYLPMPNVLVSVTPSGGDVAFLSQDSLVPGAGIGGVPAIYDARVGGGFAEPQAPSICLEEDCRRVVSTPEAIAAEARSESTHGAGNVKPHGRRCHHAKHRKRRGRCRNRRSKHKAARRPARASTSSVQVNKWQQPLAAPSGEASSTASPAPSTTAFATGEFDSFGIESVAAEASTAAAAAHPDFTVRFSLNHRFESGFPVADARVENISLSLPPGLVGSPASLPLCSTGALIAGNCPVTTQVGFARFLVEKFPNELGSPIYNLEPPHPKEEIARFGFIAAAYPVFIDIKVRTASDYGVIATVHDGPGAAPLLSSKTTLWGDPADPIHNAERFPPGEAGLPPTAFMTNPTACQPGEVGFTVTSYQLPGQLFTASAPMEPITDCQGLPFAPTFSAEPTDHIAGAPTGLKTKLVLPQHLDPDERATATMREARVTLPAGMQIAAGAANWIGTCSDDQVGFHREVDVACPDTSKLGTATIVSPALSVPIEGTLYQRTPGPGHQFGLWLTADALGLHIKLPGELEPDKQTGRLTAVFRDLPQVPVEEIDLNVWGGPRAPLQNPDRCGTYTTDFSFSPHSNDPAATGQSTMTIAQGCDQGFNPTLHAGVTKPIAGKFSPFLFDLTRDDGQQALRGFELHLPDGELAKLKGVPLCPDDAATAGSCPVDSRIGSLQATTGPGPDPLQIPQPGKPEPQIYLAGPYQGAPFSIVSEVPAQAGPFDLGILAVRSGLDVEPETGRAVVKADPLPQFFEGVGIAYRHLHAVIDRPNFSLNPTDCREMAVTSDVTSTQGAVAHPQARFQVEGCKRLKFRPRLSLKLRGDTERAGYPGLAAVLRARKGDANIAFASVALPHSEFLAQEHIGTICTRKQFAADRCPRGSVYGKAKAWTPLLAKPLSGPVYLRSSNHVLPDLVAKLGGQLEIDLVGRIDSKGGGIRTTFDSVPDAPVSKFVLRMSGGKKGLLTNSTDICRGARKATVQMKAQNGRAARLRPRLKASGCPKKKLGKHKNHR